MVLPQIVAVGIYNAQLVMKNRTLTPNRKTSLYEIELPLGPGGISYMDHDAHPVSENMLICAKPGQIRHTRLPFKCYYIHMTVADEELGRILSGLPNYIDLEDPTEFQRIFLSLCQHYGTGVPGEDVILGSLLLELIYRLGKYATAARSFRPKSNNRAVIEETLSYIRGNLQEDLSLETLAERSKFSPIYFHKLFRSATGKTLREYVEEERINRAVSLLLATDIKIKNGCRSPAKRRCDTLGVLSVKDTRLS